MDTRDKIERIRALKGYKSDRAFAAFLGVSPNTISTWYSRNSLDYELIIAKCDEVDANWLVTGEGDMLKPSGAPATVAIAQQLLTHVEVLDGELQRLRAYALSIAGQPAETSPAADHAADMQDFENAHRVSPAAGKSAAKSNQNKSK